MTGLFLLLTATTAAAGEQASPPSGCERSAPDAITVCGTRKGESPYRMPRIAKDYGPPPPPRAEFKLAQNVTANAHIASSSGPDGNAGKALMLTIKVHF